MPQGIPPTRGEFTAILLGQFISFMPPEWHKGIEQSARIYPLAFRSREYENILIWYLTVSVPSNFEAVTPFVVFLTFSQSGILFQETIMSFVLLTITSERLNTKMIEHPVFCPMFYKQVTRK